MSRMVFDEEARNKFESIINDMVSDYNSLTERLRGAIDDVYSRTKYERLGQFANEFFRAYNDEIFDRVVSGAVDIWLDSQASFVAYMTNLGAGESAVRQAGEIQDIIVDSLGMLTRLEELAISDDGELDIAAQDFLEISDAVKETAECSVRFKDDRDSLIREFIEENSVATVLQPVLNIVPGVFAAFCSKLSSAFERFEESFQDALRKQESASQEAASAIKNKAGEKDEISGGVIGSMLDGGIPGSNPDSPAAAGSPVSGGSDAAAGGSDAAGSPASNQDSASAAGSPVSGGSDAAEAEGGGKKKNIYKCFKDLKRFAGLHLNEPRIQNTIELIQYIDNTVESDAFEKRKAMPYEIIAELMPVVEKFFHKFGVDLEWADNTAGSGNSASARQKNHADREYRAVLKERNNFASHLLLLVDR